MNECIEQRLSIITNLEVGYTIAFSPLRLISAYSWYNLRYKDDGKIVIKFIMDTIEECINLLPSRIDLLSKLRDTKRGIATLKQTYSRYKKIVATVDEIILKLNEVILRFDTWLVSSLEQLPRIFQSIQVDSIHNNTINVTQSPDKMASPDDATPSDTTPCYTPSLEIGNVSPSTSPSTPPSTPTKEQNKLLISMILKDNLLQNTYDNTPFRKIRAFDYSNKWTL